MKVAFDKKNNFSGEEEFVEKQSASPFATTNLKYKNITKLLEPIIKAEEDKITFGMQKENVSMSDWQVTLCKEGDPVFLHTDGLGPCVAALAYCPLYNGDRFIGCAHITPECAELFTLKSADEEKLPYDDQKLLKRLIDGIRKDQEYGGEKVEIYFAGGSHDMNDVFTSNSYDWYCSYVLHHQSKMNLELKGIHFDPYQIDSGVDTIFSFRNSEEYKSAWKAKNENPSRFEKALSTYQEEYHVENLLSCRAGITSNGEPILRKLVDISFEYDPQKYPSYKKIVEYATNELGLNLLKMKVGVFDYLQ